jgi:methoxymalonate biosynthesis protein
VGADIDALARAIVQAVGERAEEWDLDGRIPLDVLRGLAAQGLLCAQVATAHGGLGLTSGDGGELTAATGALCSSLRSVATSQSMAAGIIARLGAPEQQERYLPRLTGGELAAAAFSEPEAGSDLSAIATEITGNGRELVVTGTKTWVTAATYADHLVVVGRRGAGAAAGGAPAGAPGVHREPIAAPLGCRAAGHADVHLDGVRVESGALLGGEALPLPLLVTAALAPGRMSVAWGCVGILRACLAAACPHAARRHQFGRPLADHQLVAAHLAELYAAERTATALCERASSLWDAGSPDAVTATVLAKHVAATQAARGSSAAVQVLASAGAHDGHPAARAYRDAKLMEIIEGSSEICRLTLAATAQQTWA